MSSRRSTLAAIVGVAMACLLVARTVTAADKQAAAKVSKQAAKAIVPLDCRAGAASADKVRLASVMKARGFRAPAGFRAWVGVVDLADGKAGAPIVKVRTFDYNGAADDVGGWNPASTIKIFTAAAAVEWVRKQGFKDAPTITIHGPRGDRKYLFSKLIRDALVESDNLAHDRLAQIGGFDELHGPNGALARAGLTHSAVMRAYQGTDWEAEGWDRSLRDSPAMMMQLGKIKKEVSARVGKVKTDCGGAACTSLAELSRFLRTVTLHEHLPTARRLKLGGANDLKLLNLLRSALATKRTHKRDNMYEALAAAFPPSRYPLYKKGGFSEGWVSDNYVIQASKTRRYLLAMAASGGWNALDQAGKIVAQVLKSNELDDKKVSKQLKDKSKDTKLRAAPK